MSIRTIQQALYMPLKIGARVTAAFVLERPTRTHHFGCDGYQLPAFLPKLIKISLSIPVECLDFVFPSGQASSKRRTLSCARL